jgi:ABC-type transport system involved in multi-copper enzyme maturation permease subunit
MTGADVPAPAGRSRSDRPNAGFSDALRSEWVKLRTLRSTYWSLLSAAVLVVGLSAVFAFAYASSYDSASPSEKASFDPTTISLSGVWFGQLAIGVLGILTITAEYASGTIWSSLAAVPRRGRMLTAKATVFAAVTLVIGEVACFAAFFVGQPILAGKAPHASLGDPGVLRAVVGAGLYLAALSLVSVALGTLIRHTAGAITVMVAVFFAIPTIMGSLPEDWQRSVAQWLPTNAGSSLWTVEHVDHTLMPWTGFGIFLAYTVAALLATFTVFARRDV